MSQNRHQTARTFALLALVLAAAVALASGATAAMVMSPFLQAVTQNSIYVLVECDSQDPVTVQYGPTTAYGLKAVTTNVEPTAATPVTYVHNVKITGLKAGTVYHYKATQDGKTFSTDAAFRTIVTRGTPFRFAALSDFRNGTKIHEAIVAKIIDAKPLISIYGGDVASSGAYAAFKNEFFQPNELKLDASVPFFNSPGNHESWSPDTKAFTELPTESSGTVDFGSFDCGDVHFLCFNDQINMGSKGPQYQFADKDLKASKAAWKIVVFHGPAYCSGGHGEGKAAVAMTTGVLEPAGVDMALAGHSHFYQHNYVNGIHHMVLGSAGAPLYDPKEAPYTLKQEKIYHYAITDVTPTTLHMVVYRNDGSVLDTIDLVKSIVDLKGKADGTTLDITGGMRVVSVNTATGKTVVTLSDSKGVKINVEAKDTAPIVGQRVKVRGTVATDAKKQRMLKDATFAALQTPPPASVPMIPIIKK